MDKDNTSIMFIIYANNQEKSKEFYKQLLGIAPRLDVPGMTEFQITDSTVLGIMPEAGIVRLLENKITNPKEANAIPRCEIYIYVDNPDEYLNKLVELGGKSISQGENRSWGDYVSYGSDIDGHILAFAKKLK